MDPNWTTFPVLSRAGTFDITQFEKQAHYLRPREVGSFSTTRENDMVRKYHDNRSGLLPLVRRGDEFVVDDLDIDLTEGYDIYIDRGQEQKDSEHLDPLLKWILKNKRIFYDYRDNINLICWRGRLHNIMVTPYSLAERWTMVVCRIDGILYMSYVDAENQKETCEDGRIGEYMYWGFKFEQIMTCEPDDTEKLSQPVSNFDSFNSVVFTKFKEIGILFGAEMDCYDEEKISDHQEKSENNPLASYVELKTCQAIPTENDMNRFCGRKLLKYWAQSFICGVQNIIVGFRDANGSVVSTDELPMHLIPEIAKTAGNQWNPDVCVNFLDQFLAFVDRVVVGEYDKAVYKFQFVPERKQVVVSRDGPKSSWMFIPEWYMTERPRYCI